MSTMFGRCRRMGTSMQPSWRVAVRSWIHVVQQHFPFRLPGWLQCSRNRNQDQIWPFQGQFEPNLVNLRRHSHLVSTHWANFWPNFGGQKVVDSGPTSALANTVAHICSNLANTSLSTDAWSRSAAGERGCGSEIPRCVLLRQFWTTPPCSSSVLECRGHACVLSLNAGACVCPTRSYSGVEIAREVGPHIGDNVDQHRPRWPEICQTAGSSKYIRSSCRPGIDTKD